MSTIFRDNGTSANYTSVGSNTTFGGNNGMFGTLGSSPSMHINFSGSDYVFEGAQKNLASTVTVHQFFIRLASTFTLGSGKTIYTVYTDNTFTNSSSPMRIDIQQQSSTTFKFVLLDSSTGASAAAGGSGTYTLGLAYRLVLYQSSSGWALYVNNGTTADATYSRTQATVGYQYLNFGTLYENGTNAGVASSSGVLDIGEVWLGNMNSAPSGATAIAAEIWEGYKQNHIALSGQPYRNGADGQNGSYVSGYIDTVSEGIAYAEVLAVQNNDQATFNLVDNWTLANLLRSNSTTTNTQNNPAPTTFLNLMSFKYNSANTDGKGIGTIYDANFATDADNERAQALLWAHARWTSSSYTVGSTNELATPNYRQRALNLLADLKTGFTAYSGKNYQWNDSYQTGTTIQMGGDYDVPAGYKLFAQYDTANATFWNAAAAGAYDSHTKAANVIFSGASPAQSTTAKLNPDWFAFDTTAGTVSTTPSTYGDSDYGFNAFRIYARLYDTYAWYGDTNALAVLQLPKSFFATETSSNANKPRATFKHDGTNTGAYSSNLFTYAAYWVSVANDSGNTTASALVSNNFTGLFSQQPYGSFLSDSPNNANPSYAYYNQSLILRDYMRMNGIYTNYGQASTKVPQGMMMGI